MFEELNRNEHIAEAALWQWRAEELDQRERAAVQQHVQSCAACQERAQTLGHMVEALRAEHFAVQPSFAEQVHMLSALQMQFAAKEVAPALVKTSQRLVRWLAPALAVLAAVFVLSREETITANSSSTSLESLLSSSREAQWLMAAEEDEAQRALLELAFSTEEK